MLKLAVTLLFGAVVLSGCSSLPTSDAVALRSHTRADTVAMLEGMDPHSSVRFHSEEMNTVPGLYQLENGSKLKVSNRMGAWQASIDGGTPVRVLPLAQGVLVAPDGGLRIAFDFDGFGRTNEVTVRYPVAEVNRSVAAR
jgi:hypothetical protein